MQREPKKILTLAQPTHVEIFVEYYDLFRRWAVKFTENDQERAEDLLHDLFIQSDAERKRLLWVGRDHTATTLAAFFAVFGAERVRQLQFICSDIGGTQNEARPTQSAQKKLLSRPTVANV